MKGIVFTELIEMVENDLGIEIADRMITSSDTSTDGAYTSVGTYDHAELIRLVISLGQETGVAVSELVRTFGRHLFSRFAILYPQFFDGITTSIEFLPLVETYIHVEVRKLYPDAELPRFECETANGILEMTYRSSRPFADLAQGLIEASIDYFQDELSVERLDLGEQNGTEARFTLSPTAVPIESTEPVACPN